MQKLDSQTHDEIEMSKEILSLAHADSKHGDPLTNRVQPDRSAAAALSLETLCY